MTETTVASDVNPFQQARLLTAERAQLFGRSAETLAERFEDELSRWLSEAEVIPGTVEQVELGDLVDGNTDLAVVKSLFQLSHGVIATGLELALSVVSMLCGGGAQPPPDCRPLSRLEMGVYDLILQPLLDLAIDLFDLGPAELGPHVSSASALPPAQPEPAIAIPLHITVPGISGTITVGLSATQLQAYSEELDRRIAGQLAARRDEPNIQVVRAVQPVIVELIAGFEPMQVPARQLVGLEIGDVIRTGQSITRPLVARVGDQRLFHIRPAQRGQRLVAELTAHIEGAPTANGPGPAQEGTSPSPLPVEGSWEGDGR